MKVNNYIKVLSTVLMVFGYSSDGYSMENKNPNLNRVNAFSEDAKQDSSKQNKNKPSLERKGLLNYNTIKEFYDQQEEQQNGMREAEIDVELEELAKQCTTGTNQVGKELLKSNTTLQLDKIEQDITEDYEKEEENQNAISELLNDFDNIFSNHNTLLEKTRTVYQKIRNNINTNNELKDNEKSKLTDYSILIAKLWNLFKTIQNDHNTILNQIKSQRCKNEMKLFYKSLNAFYQELNTLYDEILNNLSKYTSSTSNITNISVQDIITDYDNTINDGINLLGNCIKDFLYNFYDTLLKEYNKEDIQYKFNKYHKQYLKSELGAERCILYLYIGNTEINNICENILDWLSYYNENINNNKFEKRQMDVIKTDIDEELNYIYHYSNRNINLSDDEYAKGQIFSNTLEKYIKEIRKDCPSNAFRNTHKHECFNEVESFIKYLKDLQKKIDWNNKLFESMNKSDINRKKYREEFLSKKAEQYNNEITDDDLNKLNNKANNEDINQSSENEFFDIEIKNAKKIQDNIKETEEFIRKSEQKIDSVFNIKDMLIFAVNCSKYINILQGACIKYKVKQKVLTRIEGLIKSITKLKFEMQYKYYKLY